LTRLSPESTTTTRWGKPKRSAIAVAATASVAETIAPKTNAAPHGSPATQWATAATTTVVISTSPTASKRIGRRLNLKSRQEVKSAS
jgi:hypothetical protein